MIFKLAKGTKLYFGEQLVELIGGTSVDFRGIDSLNGVAELLAHHPQTFALNLPGLTHVENGTHITYGLNGLRIETPLAEVKALAAEQSKNVAAADKAAAKAAKEN